MKKLILILLTFISVTIYAQIPTIKVQGGSSGSVGTLQQVLNTGNLMTRADSIRLGGNTFTFYGGNVGIGAAPTEMFQITDPITSTTYFEVAKGTGAFHTYMYSTDFTANGIIATVSDLANSNVRTYMTSSDGTNSPELSVYGIDNTVVLRTNGGGNLGSVLIQDSSLATATNGYAWKLIDQTTGRGAWQAVGGSSGTVTSVAALTLGTSGTDLTSSVANSTTTPVITLNVPTASASNRGALSSTDWSTFNGKESALTFGLGLNRAVNTVIVDTSSASILSRQRAAATYAPISITGTVTSIATTSPITGGTITSTGTIACATCVVAPVNPSAGVAHFAGSTQTTTSSLIVNGDITNATIDLTTKPTGVLPIANGGTGAATTSQSFSFIGPTSGSGAPSFRALVAADLPATYLVGIRANDTLSDPYVQDYYALTGTGTEAFPYRYADSTAGILTTIRAHTVARLSEKRYNVSTPIIISNTNGFDSTGSILGTLAQDNNPDAEGEPKTGTRIKWTGTSAIKCGASDNVNAPRPPRPTFSNFSMWGPGRALINGFGGNYDGAAFVFFGQNSAAQLNNVQISNATYGIAVPAGAVFDAGTFSDMMIVGTRYPIVMDSIVLAGLYPVLSNSIISDNLGPIIIRNGQGNGASTNTGTGFIMTGDVIVSNSRQDLSSECFIPPCNLYLGSTTSLITNCYFVNAGLSNLLGTRITADGIIIAGNYNQIVNCTVAGQNQSGSCGVRVKSGATGNVINSNFRMQNAYYPTNATDVIIESGAVNTTVYKYPGMTITDAGTGTNIIDISTPALPKVGATYTTTTGDGLALTTSTLTSGNLVKLSSTGTGATGNSQAVLNVQLSGNNATSTQTTYAGAITNTHTGTGSTNVGLYASASGGTTNIAGIFDAGNVGMGTQTPAYKLDIRGTTGAAFGANVTNSGTAATDNASYRVANSTLEGTVFTTTATHSTLPSTVGFYTNATNGFTITDGTTAQFRVMTSNGRVGIGDPSPASMLTVGNGDLFQVNSSGAIVAATGITQTGNITLSTPGNKINITTGTNASVGVATLVGGTVTVSTTAVTASSKIFLTDATTGVLTNVGAPTVGTIVAGTSFVINSTNVLDTSAVNWWIIN